MTDLPKTLSELRSFMHGYRIKSSGDEAKIHMASILVGAIDALPEAASPAHAKAISRNMLIAATELAAIDPSLSWLPDWKPRVAVNVGSDR